MKIKRAFILLLLSLPLAMYAQTNSALPDIQMKDGKIDYELTVATNHKSARSPARNKAVKWLVKQFPNNKLSSLKSRGAIFGEGIFKVPVNANGNYYWLKFKVNVVVMEAAYRLDLSDFYEKPIEKGISNEYSKIGYRWWDYRRGHPWSAEDTALFKGLDSNCRKLFSSFETAMKN